MFFDLISCLLSLFERNNLYVASIKWTTKYVAPCVLTDQLACLEDHEGLWEESV